MSECLYLAIQNESGHRRGPTWLHSPHGTEQNPPPQTWAGAGHIKDFMGVREVYIRCHPDKHSGWKDEILLGRLSGPSAKWNKVKKDKYTTTLFHSSVESERVDIIEVESKIGADKVGPGGAQGKEEASQWIQCHSDVRGPHCLLWHCRVNVVNNNCMSPDIWKRGFLMYSLYKEMIKI